MVEEVRRRSFAREEEGRRKTQVLKMRKRKKRHVSDSERLVIYVTWHDPDTEEFLKIEIVIYAQHDTRI